MINTKRETDTELDLRAHKAKIKFQGCLRGIYATMPFSDRVKARSVESPFHLTQLCNIKSITKNKKVLKLVARAMVLLANWHEMSSLAASEFFEGDKQ